MAIKNSGDSGLFPDYWDDGDIKRWHKTLFCLDSDIIDSLFEVNDAVMTVMGNGMSLTELKVKYPADQNMADRQTIADCQTIEELKTWELYRRKELFIKMFSDPQQSWGGYITDCDNGAAVMSRIATVKNSLSERGFLMSTSFEPSNLFNILVRENKDYRQYAEADRDEFLRSFDRTVIRRLLIDEGVSEEYIDQIELTDRDPKAFSEKELIDKKRMSFCHVPALYKKFGFTENLFEIRYDHLYKNQVSMTEGVFSVEKDSNTHYHNLGLNFLYRLPLLLSSPDLVLSSLNFFAINNNKVASSTLDVTLPDTLACVLPERVTVKTRSGNIERVPIIAFVRNYDGEDNTKALFLTVFPKEEYKSMLKHAVTNKQVLFYKTEKTLRRDWSDSNFPWSATVSIVGSSVTNNISEFIQNVNIERLKKNENFFKDIPFKQITKKICNFAIHQDPLNFEYIPSKFKSVKLCFDVLEGTDNKLENKKWKKMIPFIPDDIFMDSFLTFLKKTNSNGKRTEVILNFINNNASQNQKNLIDQKIISEVSEENEMSEEDIKFLLDDDLRIYKFVEWSDDNLKLPPKYLKASRIPKHILEEAGMEENETRETPAHVLDIIGQKVEMDENGNITERGWDRLSRAVNAYSDKNYETARYFFVKDGVIVRHKAVTSGNPSRTIIAPSNDYLYQMRVFAEENGCKIVFMHNHPSGYVVPSEADIELTERMEQYFVGGNGDSLFLGHIISDHGNFGLYAPNDSNSWVAMIDGKFQPMMKINEVYKLQPSEYGIHIRTDSDLILLKEKAMELDAGNIWNKDLWIPCFYATINGIPKSLEYISVHSFSDGKGLSEQIRKLGKENNSDYIYLFPNTREQFYMCERFAQDSRMVRNVYFSREGGGFELSQFSGGNIFQQDRLSMNDINLQDSDSYGKATIDRIIADRQVEEQMELFKASDVSPAKQSDILNAKTDYDTDKKISSFEYENYNFIPVRKFADDNERQLVFENIKDKVGILKSEILKNDFPVKDFTDKGADIFYCIEKGCFYVPTKKGLSALNKINKLSVLDAKYSPEVESFRNKNYNELKKLSYASFHENVKSTMMDISLMLELGDSFSVKSPNVGDVKIFKGTNIFLDENKPIKESIKKIIHKDGLIHSVAHRYFQETHGNANISLEDMKAIKEKTSAIIFLAVNNISKSPAVREPKGNWAVYKNGIKTVIDINRKRKRQIYMVTGFDYDATKREATEAISTVIVQYGHTPEFLDIYAQVGAVVDPLQNRINQEFNSVNIKNGISGKKINEMTADELRRLADEYDRVGAVNGYDFNGNFSDYPNFNGKALNEPDYNNLKEKKNMAKKLTLDEVRSLVGDEYIVSEFVDKGFGVMSPRSDDSRVRASLSNYIEDMLDFHGFKDNEKMNVRWLPGNPQMIDTVSSKVLVKRSKIIRGLCDDVFNGDIPFEALQDELDKRITSTEEYRRCERDGLLFDAVNYFTSRASSKLYLNSSLNLQLDPSVKQDFVVRNYAIAQTLVKNDFTTFEKNKIRQVSLSDEKFQNSNYFHFFNNDKSFEQLVSEATEEYNKKYQQPVQEVSEEIKQEPPSVDISETTVKENVGEPAEVKQMELADILLPMSLGYEVSDGKIILNAFALGEGELVAFTDEFLDEINLAGMENIHDVLAAIDGYLDGHAQNFAQEIGEDDNITTWREAVSYIQEHGDTEFPKEYTDVFNALLKPDNILIDKLDVHEQGVSHDGISADVEQSQVQEQEFIGNDVSDEAVVVDTVSMSDTIDETDSVQFGDMDIDETADTQDVSDENIDDDFGIAGEQNPANVQAEKSPELSLLEKQVADLRRQNDQILELINSLKEQNEKLREENQMLREQLQQGVSPGYEGQNSQGYANSGITDYGNADQSDNTMLNPNEFSRFNAWQVGQPVPVFGMMNESGEVELFKNCVFRSFEKSELSPGEGKVILEQIQKDGNVKRIELDESRYKEMINASEWLHKALEQRDSMGNLSVDKNSFEYEQYQEKYRKSMMIDQDLFRTNYACNFVHNFKVACKLYANNPDEAMEIAKKQFNDMTKNERRRLQKEIAEYDKQFGEGAYDKLLLDQYVSSKKKQTFKDFSISGISFNSDSNDLIKDVNKEHFELPAGTPLRNDDVGDTGFKVGDSVKIGFSYTDMLGKTRNIPVSDFKIMRVSKNMQPEKSVVYCEEYKVAYELPTKELMKHLKNMSIIKKQEQFQENEKEREKYGLDVKKFLREF